MELTISNVLKETFKRYRPGQYISFKTFHNLFSQYDRKEVNRICKRAFSVCDTIRKGLGGIYYVTDENGANPFYSKEVKVSKYRMAHLKNNDIGKRMGKRGICMLKSKAEDSSFCFENYYEKRAIKNNLSSNKCRLCGEPAYCMHHILPLCKGGDNSPSNLIPVCRNCHKKIHPFMKEQESWKEDYYRVLEKE